MSNFFIHRPIFAWVVAIIIFFAGVIAIPFMPVAQYPDVAPPTVTISATYPGATAEDVAQQVTSIIENELNGAENLLYYSSTSDSYGRASIDVVFNPGTDPNMAQVEVQNKVANVSSRLPQAVIQQGLKFQKSSAGFLLIVSLNSTDGATTAGELGDYITRNIQNSISRIKGVGTFQLFAAPMAMRIWTDPAKLTSYNMTMSDVNAALAAQNVAISAGSLGAPPTPADQATSAIVATNGQLKTVDEFANIVLRANPDGSVLRVRDVARVEIGSDTYQFSSRLNGKPSAAFAISLAPNANALETAQLIKEEMEELSRYFPENIKYTIPHDTAPYVDASITQVMHTLVEAMLLVFVVMFVFLQNVRYTIIPAIVVPIALMGTVATLLGLGYSINTLTMFAMVLAIGILVDDAIVVVENVERIMAEEGLPPKQATLKAMPQIGGAIVGITLVLVTVFIPLVFMSGSSGVIYRQFAVSMIVSIAFSAFLALTFTPAMCATILKPIPKGHNETKKGFFGWFNRVFNSITNGYSGWVAAFIKRSGRMMVIYLIMSVGMAYMFLRLPSSFLPEEDQGFVITNIELPAGVSANRTLDVIETVEDYFNDVPEMKNIITVQGFSFNGTGLNSAIAFVPLKDFTERQGPGQSAQEIAGKATGSLLFGIPDAMVFSIIPPAIPSLGTASGFDLRLQDRGSLGQQILRDSASQLVQLSQSSDVLTGVRISGLGPGPQLNVKIDREKAGMLGVNMTEVSNVLSSAIGSAYLGKFPNTGWMQNVWVQADHQYRMGPEDILKLKVHNASGELVDMASFVTLDWSQGPTQVARFNSYDAITISGSAKPGYSNGEAMAEIERLIGELPRGIGYEWAGLSLQEIQAGNQAPITMALSLIVVFLVLAALYESWTIPVSAMLIVPLGMLGTVALTTLSGMANDIYFQVGMVTIIGLSAKNAILIVEFAKDAYASGRDLIESTMEAARLRFRPILMTSFAFILGVLPLVLANGAGAAGQRAVGTGVIGGMLAATPFSVLFVPVFFVVVMSIFKTRPRLLGEQAESFVSEQESHEYRHEIYKDVAEIEMLDQSKENSSQNKPNENEPEK
ncbi:MAG: multidrug efflux RND transporter permease subunit [Alcaligenaceae bacterium]|nr:multidrug efflux RND transporter permease subunit [Alcaligenaceae bacterium]